MVFDLVKSAGNKKQKITFLFQKQEPKINIHIQELKHPATSFGWKSKVFFLKSYMKNWRLKRSQLRVKKYLHRIHPTTKLNS